MIQYISAILCLSAINAQYAPQWGSITCDTSLTDFFPPNDKLSYTNYNRYYTFTASYPTSIYRDVRIQTCIEKTPITLVARVENQAWIRSATDPDGTIEYSDTDPDSISCDSETEEGSSYYFEDVAEGDWEIGVYSQDSSGGKYKLSVECIEPPKPASDDLKNTNVTQPFTYRSEHIHQNNARKISCGVSAFDTIVSGDTTDYWEFTILDYAQEITFTTGTPETAFDNNPTRPDGADSFNHYIYFYYWDFDSRSGGNGWQSNNCDYGNPATCTIGSAYSLSDLNLLKLSPGYYYIGIRRSGTSGDLDYVLSMLCWNNDAIAGTIAGTNYIAATYSPTQSPITANPTVASPTSGNPVTPSPTIYPTVTFDGVYDKVLKTMDMGTISCGIHQHKNLVKKTSDYYMFRLLTTTQIYFDTCMNDLTRFPAKLRLYAYDSPSDSDFNYVQWSETTDYCNVIDMNLGAGFYYVEISGQTKKTDYGEYLLRMGCEIGQEDQVTVVSATDEPTPSPTGVAQIPAKDGRVVGDIMCGVTVEGTTSSRKGDFHRFTIIKGGIDWVKFDTCDATSFENYLFVYDYWNQTAHEQWNYQSYNSIGFHYEDDTTCNHIIMNDLVPGVYYVNIDGYNYYFDHGEYTIKMTCSDNGAVKSTGNFTEYSAGLEWWIILLIVLGCLICCGCIIFGVCYMKRKQDSGGNGTGGSEMANRTDDAGE